MARLLPSRPKNIPTHGIGAAIKPTRRQSCLLLRANLVLAH
jgi:hypothetical protein